MKKVKVLGVQFDAVRSEEALERVRELFHNRPHEGGKMIATPNPEMLLHAQKDERFREILNGAFLSLPDGIGVLWAAKFQTIKRTKNPFARLFLALFSLFALLMYPRYVQSPIPERVTGVDFMKRICAFASKTGKKIFLLGAGEGVAERVKHIVKRIFPDIHIVGTSSLSPHDADFPKIQKHILETEPDFLFVAFGAPAQEYWIAKHLKKFPSVKAAMGVGGAFDFLTGIRKRAPKWMQRLGLEWLYRLLQEPARCKRIWNATIRFPITVIKAKY